MDRIMEGVNLELITGVKDEILEQLLEQLLADTPPFDARTASVLPEVGWLAEGFRVQRATVLSINSSGRFAARGRDAELLLSDQPWNDYYGPGSPLAKLCDAGERCCALGRTPTR